MSAKGFFVKCAALTPIRKAIAVVTVMVFLFCRCEFLVADADKTTRPFNTMQRMYGGKKFTSAREYLYGAETDKHSPFALPAKAVLGPGAVISSFEIPIEFKSELEKLETVMRSNKITPVQAKTAGADKIYLTNERIPDTKCNVIRSGKDKSITGAWIKKGIVVYMLLSDGTVIKMGSRNLAKGAVKSRLSRDQQEAFSKNENSVIVHREVLGSDSVLVWDTKNHKEQALVFEKQTTMKGPVVEQKGAVNVILSVLGFFAGGFAVGAVEAAARMFGANPVIDVDGIKMGWTKWYIERLFGQLCSGGVVSAVLKNLRFFGSKVKVKDDSDSKDLPHSGNADTHSRNAGGLRDEADQEAQFQAQMQAYEEEKKQIAAKLGEFGETIEGLGRGVEKHEKKIDRVREKMDEFNDITRRLMEARTKNQKQRIETFGENARKDIAQLSDKQPGVRDGMSEKQALESFYANRHTTPGVGDKETPGVAALTAKPDKDAVDSALAVLDNPNLGNSDDFSLAGETLWDNMPLSLKVLGRRFTQGLSFDIGKNYADALGLMYGISHKLPLSMYNAKVKISDKRIEEVIKPLRRQIVEQLITSYNTVNNSDLKAHIFKVLQDLSKSPKATLEIKRMIEAVGKDNSVN